ncbi:uncharacterized protein EV420DRAFT_1566039 [Desarmillaria tabescens]|uniref:BZIP domain-containing protein n=1 Tax=Armillaria tabescens TaxID=1929756 RepID=A0AA39MWR9_ARMTA|nr:uncharacterized protein EV420DRAFT_1566039 [Desarmillaria tabescens]KAK0448894.1 hypothetical protein EV420DRAFT_1566039 [Desarmillaria tabescens]
MPRVAIDLPCTLPLPSRSFPCRYSQSPYKMSRSKEDLIIPLDTEAQIEDLKRERDKSRTQHLETLKKLRRKADVERDNDTLRKENERLRKDLDDAKARALKVDEEATDLWGQKETVEYENRGLKRLVARLQERTRDVHRTVTDTAVPLTDGYGYGWTVSVP